MRLLRGVYDEADKRESTLPWLGAVPLVGFLALAEIPSSTVRVTNGAKRSVLKPKMPTAEGYSHKAIV